MLSIIAQLPLEENKITYTKKYTMYQFFSATLEIISEKVFEEPPSFIFIVLKFLVFWNEKNINFTYHDMIQKCWKKQMSILRKRQQMLINIDFEH